MANETTVQIPLDINDPIVMRRVLLTIVEEIDKLRGTRGSTAPTQNTRQGPIAQLDLTINGGLAGLISNPTALQEMQTKLNDLITALENANIIETTNQGTL